MNETDEIQRLRATVAGLMAALVCTVQGCEVCGGTGWLCPIRKTVCTNCVEARAALAAAREGE